MALNRHITGTAHQGGNFTAGKMPTTTLINTLLSRVGSQWFTALSLVVLVQIGVTFERYGALCYKQMASLFESCIIRCKIFVFYCTRQLPV